MTAEDATAYRAFLRAPSPRARWIGPPRPLASGEWRPFAGSLSANSIKYALSVIGTMYRWLVEQGYLLANPFSGMKVRGATASKPLDAQRMFSQGEWALVRVIAKLSFLPSALLDRVPRYSESTCPGFAAQALCDRLSPGGSSQEVSGFCGGMA